MARPPSAFGTGPYRRPVTRVLVIACAALGLLLIAAVAVIHTPLVRRYVLRQVTQLLAAQQIAVDTDELDYNLLDLSLSLRNIVVRAADPPGGPAFASIGRARVDLSLFQLVRGHYVVESAVLDGVTVHYLMREDGTDNLPRPLRKPDAPSEPIAYLIDTLSTQDASVRYEDRLRHVDVTLPITRLAVNGNRVSGRHRIEFETAPSTANIQDRTARIDRVSGRFDLGQDDVAIEQLELSGEGADIGLNGAIDDFDRLRAKLTLRATADIASAVRVAGLNEPATGALELEAAIAGDLGAPVIDATVTGTGLAVRRLDGMTVHAMVGYDAGARHALVRRLEAKAPFGQVAAEGELAVEPSGRSRLRAEASGVDAATIMRALDLDMVAATRLAATVDASWPGLDYLDATGNAQVELTPTTRQVTASSVPVGGRVDVAARDGLVATLHDVSAAGVTTNGRVTLTERGQLGGVLRARVGDVLRSTAAAEALLGRRAGSLLPTPVRGPAVIEARMGGTLESPAVAATVAGSGLGVGALTDVEVNSAVAYTPDSVTVETLLVRWRDARIEAQGLVGLRGRRPIDLTFAADAVDVPSVLAALEVGDVPVSGSFAARGGVSGTVALPSAAVTLRGDGLEAYAEHLGTLSGRVDLTDREVRVAELRLAKPQPEGDGELTASGTYRLDTEAYTIEVASRNLRVLTAMLPDGRAIRGQVGVSGSGQGTIADPGADIELTAETLQVADADLGRVALHATVAEQRARVTATADRFGVDGDGVIGVRAPYPAVITVRADGLDLTALPQALDTPLDGVVRASVEAAGDLATPARLAATATIASFAGRWNGQPFEIEAPSILRYGNERLTIESLRLTAAGSSVDLSGELPLTDRTAAGAIALDAYGDLATLSQYAPADFPISGDGALTVSGTLRGTLSAIDPDLTIAVDNGLVLTAAIEPGLSNVQMRARVADGVAELSTLSASWGTARLAASGRVPLEVLPALPVEIPRQGGPATITASLAGLDLAAVPGAPAGLSGRISFDAEATAARADLAALEGRISFPDLQVDFSGLTLAQQQPTVVGIAGGVATLEPTTLTGTVGTLSTSGSVGLAGERPIAVAAEGTVNLGAVNTLTEAVHVEGDLALRLDARGTVASPEVDGTLELADGAFAVDEPQVAAENVVARIELAGRSVNVTTLTADVNGGTLTGSGALTLGADGLDEADLRVSARDFAFDAPLDLRSLSDSDLRLARQGDELVLDGTVTIQEAGLTGDINFDTGLLAAIDAPPTLDLTRQRNPLLERVRFDVHVVTATPILLDNNLAKAETMADLRVLGTPYDTGLSGQLTIQEGGEITLNERRYNVERGVISFIDDRRIVPAFDLELSTSVRSYDITLNVTGSPGDAETTLTSEPSLPEPDIMAILFTGRTLDEMRGEEYDVAREQVLSLLAGRVGSSLGRGIEEATGLSEVRIEPNLIANEADPSARLTVGQELTTDLELVYSTDLTDSSDQIWTAQYDVTRRFQTNATRQSDSTYRMDFRHDVRFGGMPEPRRQPRLRPTVERLDLTGDQPLPTAEMRELIGVDEGKPLDYFAVRDGIQKLEERLRERGFLQSRVRLRREVADTSVRLHVAVTAGPVVALQILGGSVPDDVREEVRLKWHRGVFDAQRVDDGVETLRAWLIGDSHLQPKVDYTVTDTSQGREVVFQVTPGPKYDTVVLAFEGAVAIDPKELDAIVDDQDLEQRLFTDPLVVTELLERYYHEQGYLAASIDTPRYEFEGTTGRIVLDVREGRRFHVRQLSTTGNTMLTTPVLLQDLPVVEGEPFLPVAAENALTHIRGLYWGRGYNDATPAYRLAVNRELGEVDVAFTIREGARSVVSDIVVSGQDRTSDRLVREQLEVEPSQALDLAALSRSRRNLYDTGAFSVVDVIRETVTPAEDNGAGNGQDQPGGQTQTVQVNVAVREVQPFQLSYGASFDTERGLGGILDLSNHNSLGNARVVGTRLRYDRQLTDGRLYLSQPSLRYFPVALTGSVYYREDRNPTTEITRAFNVSRKGVSIQAERELRNAYVWTYGYRYEHARNFDPNVSGQTESLVVAPLTSTLTREQRDDVMDASRGSFVSQALSYSPEWLGARQSYLKYFGQYFHYFPLQAPRRKPFTTEVLRPRLVFAAGVRLGLGRGIDGPIPFSERFFAGGSTTMRGFAQNAVGPIGPDNLPTGGNAMLVFNGELRSPLFKTLDGVVFADIGNVYPRVQDLSLTDLRESVGVGLRLRTPWFLLRGDYGFVLDPRAGERRTRFYFSIGQAF